ncbi:glycine oxidase ThiO [Cobetia crustatorum]|uniref:Glycine oxidase ThiO n=1 Tax=Cobetia crustatorum TaxID=553385 RepID=A0A558HN25_9GAMM|nr:glycine oxidase ThiO [Cobetia crustatorum]TVU70534.1 glycine oxidase ThiO [Cobetia crustatorum]
MSDTLIIGGGVIGMMMAWQLADAGQRVTLLERGQCGREASWAGGGIVSPLYPWRYSNAISSLSRWSEGEYPRLAEALIEATGIDPEYRQKGLIYLRVEDEALALDWARTQHKPLEVIGQEALYAREPYLATGHHEALWMPTLGSIRNPRLGQALRACLIQHPRVEVREGCDVQRLMIGDDQRVAGALTAQGVIKAGQVVVCGGAWSGKLLAEAGVLLPVRPVKGQMMVFNPVAAGLCRVEDPLLSRVVLCDGRYVIPRADGRILIGSTLEHKDFDKSTTAEARESLHASAASILPALSELAPEHHWAGLRPGTPDGTPFIGAVPGLHGLYVNAGHYRNGLVLAPAATRLLSDILLGRESFMSADAFTPPGVERKAALAG